MRDGNMVIREAVEYGIAPLRGKEKPLHVDIYQPAAGRAPGPVFVWFHSGAFKVGKYNSHTHRAMARWLTAAGITVLTPEYRLGTPRADLSKKMCAKTDELWERRDKNFRRNLAQAKSLAALEDGLRFLHWLQARREALNVAGKIVLGGSSAGAINAFNICFTAPFLGFAVPAIGGIVSYSGGYAYPGLYRPGAVPVFAAHNPKDRRVTIASIRKLKEMDPAVELIESNEQLHGAVALFTGESRQVKYARLAETVLRMSGDRKER